MYAQAHNSGSLAALADFGLSKEASLGQTIKRVLVGDPGRLMKELRGGSPFAKGTMLRDAIVPETTLGKVMSYGFPALGLYNAMQAPSEQRGSAIGSLLGGTIGGTLGQPLGIAGSIAGSSLLGPLGQRIGRAFDGKPQPQHDKRDDDSDRRRSHATRPQLSDQLSRITGRPTSL